MKNKISISFIVVIVLSIMLSSFGFAHTPDFTHYFVESYGNAPIVNAYSPARTGSGSNNFVKVISKSNQPRNTNGTNPHIGVDLNMSEGTNVYSIYSGKVVSVNDTTSSQLGYVQVNLDITGDGVPDGYYIRFIHIVPSVQVNDWVDSTDIVGTVDSYKVYPPHLHFGRESSNLSLSYKMFPFYRSVSAWSYGSDLDLFTDERIEGNKLYIKGYIEDDSLTYALTRVEVYYKINNGSWSDTPAQMQLINSSTYEWEFDFSSIANSGQTVYYYLAGIRDNVPASIGNWGLWPQYYKKPPLKPSQFGTNQIQYNTHTVTSSDDHGDSRSTATPVSINSTTPGVINFGGDVDYFKFTTSSTGTYTIETASSIDTYGYLYDAYGTEITHNDDGGENTNFYISYNLSSNTTYYVKVRHYSSSGTGNYNLKIQYQSGSSDDHGDDIYHATRLYINSPKSGVINYGGDVDYFVVNSGAYTSLTFYTTGSTDTYGYLYSASGSILDSDDDSGQSYNFSISYSVTPFTDYYIKVRHYSSSGTGSYTIYAN